MIIAYSDISGNLLVVHGAPKEHLEAKLGPLTDQQYSDLIWESVPKDAVNARELDRVPVDRTFRAAWKDITSDPLVDICPVAAKDIALTHLRARRNQALSLLDGQELLALSKNDSALLSTVREKKDRLRAATDPLKAIAVSSEVAGDNLLEEFKRLMDAEL